MKIRTMLAFTLAALALCACGGGGGSSLAPTVPAATPAPPSSTPNATPTPVGVAPSAITGVIIPMYVDPGPLWNQVIADKLAHPRVPILMIVGSYNGLTLTYDQRYVAAIAQAQAAGIVVLGYVYTSVGARATNVVEADMSSFKTWYNVNGIFLDEMATNAPTYYQTLTSYAHAAGMRPVVGNPGEDAPATAGTDIINFYEQGGYPTLSFLAEPAHMAVAKTTWSYIAENVTYNQATVLATLPYVGWVYALDEPAPSCYCGLPTAFDSLIAALDANQ